MTKEMLDELLYLIELQIKANIAIALGHADAADKEAEREAYEWIEGVVGDAYEER